MSVQTFNDLLVWQKAHALTLEVYKVTKSFPKEEFYSLVQQLRRSSSSISTNIVEGHKRKTTKDFLHFLNIAEASLEETKYHLLLSKDLNYINQEIYKDIKLKCDEVGRMLYGFQNGLREKIKQ